MAELHKERERREELERLLRSEKKNEYILEQTLTEEKEKVNTLERSFAEEKLKRLEIERRYNSLLHVMNDCGCKSICCYFRSLTTSCFR